jgi:hypothetical protein
MPSLSFEAGDKQSNVKVEKQVLAFSEILFLSAAVTVSASEYRAVLHSDYVRIKLYKR